MTQSGQNRGMGKYVNGNIPRNVIHHNKKYTFKWFLQHFVIDQRVLDATYPVSSIIFWRETLDTCY